MLFHAQKQGRGAAALRLLAFLLAVCLPLSLTGCGSAPAVPDAPDSSPAGSAPAAPGTLPDVDYTPWLSGPLLEDAPIMGPDSLPAAPDSSPDSTSTPDSSPDNDPDSGTAPPADPGQTEPFRWHYDRLDATCQQLYLEIYDAIAAHADRQLLATSATKQQLNDTVDAVRCDHPELFWFSGDFSYEYFTANGKLTDITIKPDYEMTAAQAQEYLPRLEALRDDLLAAMPAGDDYTRAMYLYRWIAENTTYVTGAPLNQTLISSMLLKESVCAGYARALQYLMNAAGMPCTYLSGSSKGESHAWSLARLDGEWYYMDVTWGDSDVAGRAADGSTPQLLNYEYFTMTWDQLRVTHTPDLPDLPACSATANLYFVRNGLQQAGWDPAAVQTHMTAAATAGQPSVSLCYTAKADYNAAMAAAKSGEITAMLRTAAETAPNLQTGSLRYFYNDDRYVLMLVLEYN